MKIIELYYQLPKSHTFPFSLKTLSVKDQPPFGSQRVLLPILQAHMNFTVKLMQKLTQELAIVENSLLLSAKKCQIE